MTISRANVSAIAEDLYVWLPPKRGWGLANCGLLASPGTALWIDTPYDPSLAAEFLAESRQRLADGVTVDRIVVTHANGDHLWGAGVLPDAEVIATREALGHIHWEPSPKQQHALVTGSDPASLLGGYLQRHFGQFDWSETEPVHPQTVFSGELELRVGEYPVQITALPSAHTGGDLIVHLPHQRAVFTGDVIFGSTPEQPGDHPSHWAGPLENVIGACEQALATGAEIFVPGHGPVLDRSGVRDHIAYLGYVRERAHALHEAGIPALDAARRIIAEQRHPELGLPERLVLTVAAEYRHLDGSEVPNVLEAMSQVALVARELDEDAGRPSRPRSGQDAPASA
ncbi:MBL fold metallo-hydrolase [Streptomyces sp. CB01881]|uniref:MBL fold metallo-hydrolase n=1 Tax=Streptomyces sp. CB01881 TaxID=2078691 RepID=UPI000CDCA65B|nr:MBL fold metallo-hydrolase [Streptomyces sp. CB01881]AUY49468.1 MBL fold metallo-hydrolase [Streptomyces sp. CB01881]TYC72852.1 MBL fold metallo-hydrolase [Streptomyces sp. CB01881]